MNKHLLLIAILLGSTSISEADIVIIDQNFDSGTDGASLGGATGWNAKWDGTDTSQRNLYTFQSGGVTLDTSTAKRNYHALFDAAIDLSAYAGPVTISSEFRYTHETGGNITANLNKNAFGLLVSTTNVWWSGTNYSTHLGNRGAAIGNPLPTAPWVENWLTHSSLGIDTATGGTSDWLRMDYVLTDNGTTVMGTTNVYDVATGNLLTGTSASYDTGIASGSTIYAGLSTGWNNVGDVAISSFSKFSSVEIDNFRATVTAVPEPSSFAMLGLGLCGFAAYRRRNKSAGCVH